MDTQYYKRLAISVSGIYVMYLCSYRYVAEDGTRFQYTTALLFIQCLINIAIAVLGALYSISLIPRTTDNGK